MVSRASKVFAASSSDLIRKLRRCASFFQPQSSTEVVWRIGSRYAVSQLDMIRVAIGDNQYTTALCLRLR